MIEKMPEEGERPIQGMEKVLPAEEPSNESFVSDNKEKGGILPVEGGPARSVEEINASIAENNRNIEETNASIRETRVAYNELRKELGLEESDGDPMSVALLKDRVAALEKQKEELEGSLYNDKHERGKIFMEHPIVVRGDRWQIPDELLSLNEDELVSLFFSGENDRGETNESGGEGNGTVIEMSNPEAFRKVTEGITKGMLSREFGKFDPQELKSIAESGLLPDGKEVYSATMGTIDPESAKKLATAFIDHSLKVGRK